MVWDGLRNFLDPRQSVRKRRKRDLSFLTKWFRRFPHIQPQAPVYSTIRSLEFEIPPDESEPDPVLTYAGSALKQEDLAEALYAYTHLVRGEKNLGTVIRDLQAITCGSIRVLSKPGAFLGRL